MSLFKRYYPVLVAVLVAVLPLGMNTYWTEVAVNVGLYALLALSLNVILGQAGIFHMGHAAFYAVGAYVTAILNTHYQIPILLLIPVAGAAAATVLGQIVAMFMAIFFNLKWNKEIRLSVKRFYVSGKIIRQIYAVGVPSICMAAIGSVMTFGMNKILIAFTSTATAVFGVYFKLQSFIFMPVFGLNNGMVPIISYNYGAKKKKRILGTIKLAVLFAVCIMAAGTILFQCFPRQLLSLFSASEHMMSMGVPALRIISIHFIIAAYGIVISSVFQALGDGMPSLIMSVSRQLVVLLPAAWLLSLTGEVNNIWWAFLIAEFVSAALCTIFFIRDYNRKLKHLDE